MIAFENISVVGWEPAIRGMRNPMNSWEKSDSIFRGIDTDAYMLNGDTFPWPSCEPGDIIIGENDLALMKKLAAAGSDHAKFRRMIVVYMDITAPLYWWKEFDTYKVGTVANSCSTMHKIADKEFTLEDFSTEHLISEDHSCDIYIDDVFKINPIDVDEIYSMSGVENSITPMRFMSATIEMLNTCRTLYLETNDKRYWWQMIQLLPSSYNQKRTVMMNYEVLANIYRSRCNHKLDEWHGLCKLITALPYAEGIIFPELTEEEKLASDILLGDGSWDPVEGENGSD